VSCLMSSFTSCTSANAAELAAERQRGQQDSMGFHCGSPSAVIDGGRRSVPAADASSMTAARPVSSTRASQRSVKR
jgi:predicted nucleic acid-binding Zn ribbon protein